MRVHFLPAGAAARAIMTLVAACVLVAAPARGQQTSATCSESYWAEDPLDRARLQAEIVQVQESTKPIQASISLYQAILEDENHDVAHLQTNLATLRNLEATLQKTIADNERVGYYENDPNSQLYNPLRNLLKLTQDRIAEVAQSMTSFQKDAADTAGRLKAAQSQLNALTNEQNACSELLAKQPAGSPPKENAPLPPFIQNTAKQNQPMPSVKPSPSIQAPPKPSPAAPLAGTWTFQTAGGCQYQGGHIAGVTHEPDGPMQLKSDGNGGYTGTVEGPQIISSVDQGSLIGSNVTLTVHPHTYFDDPKLNPPKNPLTGGWIDPLVLKGTLSVNGDLITGQVFHDSNTPDCSFTMTR
jgi:hypothetical protein